MIPKIIHYCWFGGNPLPKKTRKFMESWKKYCPGFEIREWNETNFDVCCCSFVKEAYQEKKWAFVADYARFYAMYSCGGVYLETDTELIKPIDDLLEHSAFFGFGRKNSMTLPCCGTERGSQIAYDMIEYYHNSHFCKQEGIDTTTVNNILFDILLSKYQLVANNKFQMLDGGIAIYPSDYFYSTDWQTGIVKKDPNLRVIHYADATWFPDSERKAIYLKRKLIKMFGLKTGNFLFSVITVIKNNGMGYVLKRIIGVENKNGSKKE